MKHLSQLVSFATLATSALAGPVQFAGSDVQCFENHDTAWWRPPGSLNTPPTVTVQDICNNGGSGGCQSGYGRLCVLGDLQDCGSLVAAVGYYQKFTGSRWEFPSVIQCGNVALSVASN
ncbi:hypothetical protein V8C35DRAFT_311393 [Trichoderma chlorosporum]